MQLGEIFSKSRKSIKNFLWIICVPILLDLTDLFAYQYIYKTTYTPLTKIFTIKIGLISAPPSVKFLLEDFPSAIFQYNNNGFKSIIDGFTLFNVFFMITVMLIVSFINSGYLGILGTKEENHIEIKDFFVLGNLNWFKFFILTIIQFIPMFLIIISRELIVLSMILGFISIVFMYVKYSIIVDEVDLKENFSKGFFFLFDNLGLTIKMAFYFGFIFSLLSIGIYWLASLGTIGVVIDIIIMAYLGLIVNKSVLEVYRTNNNFVDN